MDPKRNIFTLGTIESFQTTTLLNIKQLHHTLDQSNQQPNSHKNLPNLGNKSKYTSLISVQTLSQLPNSTFKSKFIKKPAKGK